MQITFHPMEFMFEENPACDLGLSMLKLREEGMGGVRIAWRFGKTSKNFGCIEEVIEVEDWIWSHLNLHSWEIFSSNAQTASSVWSWYDRGMEVCVDEKCWGENELFLVQKKKKLALLPQLLEGNF